MIKLKRMFAPVMFLSITLFFMPRSQSAEKEKQTIVINGSSTVGPIVKTFAEWFMKQTPDIKMIVNDSGSGNGMKAFIAGKADIAMMSRPMKMEEFRATLEQGRLPCVHTIALDGLAIIIYTANPIDKLSMEQLRNIYLGRITNWKEMGGMDKQIVPISRDTSAGTYETFESIVMRGDRITNQAQYVGSSGNVRGRVQGHPKSIGYCGLGYLDLSVKGVLINGRSPSHENIQNGIYPIARPLYIITDGYPAPGSMLARFLKLFYTPKGDHLIHNIGFIPLTRYKNE